MNSYYRATPATELTILELASIESPRERESQIRAAKLRMFFWDYSLFNGDDGSELQERAFQLGITEDEWEAHRESFRVEF
jgi:hypothetical protein